MPYDLPLQELFKHREIIYGTLVAAGTVGTLSKNVKEVVVISASDCFIDTGTTAALATGLFVPAGVPMPFDYLALNGTIDNYAITAIPRSGTAEIHVIGYY